jgi:hypothetical protein
MGIAPSEEFYDKYDEWATMSTTSPRLVGNVLYLTANRADGDLVYWQLVSNDKKMYPFMNNFKCFDHSFHT